MKEFIPVIFFLLFVYGFVIYISPADYYLLKKERLIEPILSPTDEQQAITDITDIHSDKKALVGKYTPFEVAIYYLKAHESFRPYEYPDGKYPSKGFGLNLTPEHEQWASVYLGYPARSRNWTFKEGEMLLHEYWKEKHAQFLQSNEDKDINMHQLTAMLLHKYNTGKTHNIRGCCGSKTGCGRKNDSIKNAHNKRRDFEHRLYHNQVTEEEIESFRQKAIKIQKKWS